MPRSKPPIPDSPRVTTREVSVLLARSTSRTRKLLAERGVDVLWVNGQAAWLASDVNRMLAEMREQGAPKDTSKARAAAAAKRQAAKKD